MDCSGQPLGTPKGTPKRHPPPVPASRSQPRRLALSIPGQLAQRLSSKLDAPSTSSLPRLPA